MRARLAFFAARLAVAILFVLTALYCLLAYIPFTYHQIHLGGLVAWVSAFAHYQPYLYWLALAAAGLTLPWDRGRVLRLFSALFLAVYGIAGVALLRHPLLSGLENNLQSVYWSLLALTPLLWIAMLDWTARWRVFSWQPAGGEAARLFWACLLAALWAWLLSATVVIFRYAFSADARFNTRQWVAALAWSLALHIVVFMSVFLILNLVRAITFLLSERAAVQVIFFAAAVVALLTLILKYVVFVPLSFSGYLGNATAVAFAFSLTAFFSGVSVRLYRNEDGPIESALDLLLGVVRFLKTAHPGLRISTLLAGSALSAYLLIRATTTDWEFLLQKIIVIGTWAAAFAFFYLTPRLRSKRHGSLVITAALFPCLYMGYIGLSPRFQPDSGNPTSEAAGFLDDYRNYDIGFRLASDLTSPPRAAVPDDSFFAFLAGNTNIPRSVRTDPVQINLTPQIAPAVASRPNIFMIVIDSLRRDYVSPYNSEVTFTPGMDAFARESVVFQNAFTRYTGTGLSEPSIWAGAMLLHKQYVTPFYPMNSLQRLLEAENYRQFVARDEILKTIMAPSARVTALEANQATMNLEACPTLAELREQGRTDLRLYAAAGHPRLGDQPPEQIGRRRRGLPGLRPGLRFPRQES